MSSKKAKSRIFWRTQGGERRAYADFRGIGGGREALIVAGESRATTDPLIAEKLVANRLSELQAEKRNGVLLGVKRKAKPSAFVAEHLVQKAKSGRFSDTWLADSERMLTIAIKFFGSERDLATIAVTDVQSWISHEQARRHAGRWRYPSSSERALQRLQAGTVGRLRTTRVQSVRCHHRQTERQSRRGALAGSARSGVAPGIRAHLHREARRGCNAIHLSADCDVHPHRWP
jgi:hypothetical protein